MTVINKRYTYIFIFISCLRKLALKSQQPWGRSAILSCIRDNALAIEQKPFLIYHHSDLLCNTFVNGRPIKHKTAAFLYY